MPFVSKRNTTRRRRATATARTLRFECVESRVMLSGETVIDLQLLLGSNAHANWLSYQVVDGGVTWTFSNGNNFYLSFDSLSAISNSDALTNAGGIRIDLDADGHLFDAVIPGYIEAIRNVLPDEPMRPIEVDPPGESMHEVAMIDLSTMLRQSATVQPAVDLPLEVLIARSKALHDSPIVQRATSPETEGNEIPLVLPLGDQVHLERSWSFEVALLPKEISAATDSPAEQHAPEQSRSVNDASGEVSSTTNRSRQVGTPNWPTVRRVVALAREDPTPSAVEMAIPGPEEKQEVRDAAFAGWTGHAEVRRYAVTGTILAVLAAMRWRAPQSASRNQHEQRPEEKLPLRIR